MCQQIFNNLNQLLNSRQGMLAHMPHYGVPDINDVFVEIPYSLRVFQQKLLQAIQTYEPRLHYVNITYHGSDGVNQTVTFRITAKIDGTEPIGFDASFISQGGVVLEQLDNA